MIQAPHIHAQDAAVFLLFLLLVVVMCTWRDARKEMKEGSNKEPPKLPIKSYTHRRFDSEL